MTRNITATDTSLSEITKLLYYNSALFCVFDFPKWYYLATIMLDVEGQVSAVPPVFVK